MMLTVTSLLTTYILLTTRQSQSRDLDWVGLARERSVPREQVGVVGTSAVANRKWPGIMARLGLVV